MLTIETLKKNINPGLFTTDLLDSLALSLIAGKYVVHDSKGIAQT